MTFYQNAHGMVVTRQESDWAHRRGINTASLVWRTCKICSKTCNCYNGWCGQCLEDFRAVYNHWPCEKDNPIMSNHFDAQGNQHFTRFAEWEAACKKRGYEGPLEENGSIKIYIEGKLLAEWVPGEPSRGVIHK